MAFLHQLKLLLWKNGLAAIRQPLWSVTLITWPLIVFIIVAVTRHQFPPIVRQPCYVGPRNLPSTGFFPFLQTLMCNTDSHCHNTSRLVDPTATRSSRSSSRFSAKNVLNLDESLNVASALNQRIDTETMVDFLKSIVGSHGRGLNNISVINFSETLDNETLHAAMKSASMIKKTLCSMVLPTLNTTQSSVLTFIGVTYCTTNETMFEASLNTLNQVLMELLVTKPEEVATFAGMAVVAFDRLQNETSLWESLLAIPPLLRSGSVDQALDRLEGLLTNILGTMNAIQSEFPEADVPLPEATSLFAPVLSLIHYTQNWSGREVYISLGDVVKLENDSLSEMVRQVLPEVKIPLDKAIALTLDKETVHMYVCNSSSTPLWLVPACSLGTVRMLLGWIDPDLVAKQTLLAWSKYVAPRDLAFTRGFVSGLLGQSSPGGQEGNHIVRRRRSVETQPQSIDEELFLWFGGVVLDVLQMIPEAETIVHNLLSSGVQSMKIVTLTFETLEEITEGLLNDADRVKQTFQTLVSNPSEASVWISEVLDSGVEAVMMAVTSANATCEDVFSPFEWLLNSETIQFEVLRSTICQGGSDLGGALLMTLMPLIESAQDFNSTVSGQSENNITLPMILSEWQKLYNYSQQLLHSVDRLAMELGGAYWKNWMPENCTHDATETLQQSAFLFMVKVGRRFEMSELWHVVKNYFHMVNWVLTYRSGVDTPLNCTGSVLTSFIDCKIEKDFEWPEFITTVTQTLMSPSPYVLLNYLKGAVNLLQRLYRDSITAVVGSFLERSIHGGEALTSYLTNLLHNLQGFIMKVLMLPDENITNPEVMSTLVSDLFQSTGLSPLLPLLLHDSPINVSTVLSVATSLIRQNQHIFTFNETDTTMPELEKLIMQVLSLEDNHTMSIYNLMGQTLLTYAGYFHPDDVTWFMEAIRPFTNQTSAGIVKAFVRAVDLLKTVTDAPNGDPTNVIQFLEIAKKWMTQPNLPFLLANLMLSGNSSNSLEGCFEPHQDQIVTAQCVMGLVNSVSSFITQLPVLQNETSILQMIPKIVNDTIKEVLNGDLGSDPLATVIVTLNTTLANIKMALQMNHLNTPEVMKEIKVVEGLIQLTANPDSCGINMTLAENPTYAEKIYLETISCYLKQVEIIISNSSLSDLLQPFLYVLHKQVSLQLLQTDFTLFVSAQVENLMDMINLPLDGTDLSHIGLTALEMFQRLFQLIRGNLEFQNNLPGMEPFFDPTDLYAFEHQMNKYLEIAKKWMTQPNLPFLLANLMLSGNSSSSLEGCFEPHQDQIVTAQCVMGLVNSVSSFIAQLPVLQNETSILQMIPKIVNDTVKEVLNGDLGSDPLATVIVTLNTTLANIKMALQMNHLNTQEVMTEIRVVEGLIQLAANPDSCGINMTLAENPTYAEKIYLETISCYLKQVEIIISNSSLSDLLQPFLYVLHKQVSLQLLQTDFTLFVSAQVENLMGMINLPLDGTDLSHIGLTVVEMFQRLFQLIRGNLEFQNNLPGMEPFFDPTDLYAFEHQMNKYLEIAKKWMTQPNLPFLLANLMLSGNSSNSLEGCFEPHQDQIVTAQCVMGLVNSVSSFITQLPVLQNETSILQMIPKIVNDTIKEVLNGDLGSDPLATVIVTLNTTLANIKMALQMNHLNTPEVMKEIKVVEGLIQLAANPDSCGINMTLAENPTYAEKIYLETISCYLKHVEIIISNSSLSDLLQPFLYVLHKQVSLQLLQTDFTLFVSAQVENLMDMINLPLDGTDLSHIGLTVVEMFQRLFQLIRGNLEFQNNLPGMEPFFDPTDLYAFEHQMNKYLEIAKKWMMQPNLPFLLANLMLSGNSSSSLEECFEPHQNQMATAQCVMGLVNSVSSFIAQLPVLQNETSILQMIPKIVNDTIKEVLNGDLGSDPLATVIVTLNTTLANIKMALQMNHLNTPEVMKEIKVVEGLLQLAANPDSCGINMTLAENPTYAEKIYLETISCYLKQVEIIISNSSLSDLLQPFLYVLQKQVSLQLLHTDFTLFVSGQVENLMDMINLPLDGTDLSHIGLTALEMFQRLFQLIRGNLEFQNNLPGMEPFFDPTDLNAFEHQMNKYLEIAKKWMTQPNLPFLLANLMLSGNSSNSLEGCFEPHQNQMVTAQCVMGLINSVSSFITQLPVLQNETSILQMIPKIVNDTIKEVLNGDLGSDPLATVIVTLNTTLANIKMVLQMNHLNTPEVMKEIKVVEGLIQLAANPDSCGINMTLAENPTYAEKIYLETISCYLKQVEIIISNSSLSDLLQPFLYVLHKQVSLQLLHTDFTLFVSAQVENLMDMINLPLDGTDLSHIGLTVVEMFQRLFQLIRGNLEFQNNLPGMEPFFDPTDLNAFEHQMNKYLEIAKKWMTQPNLPFFLANLMLSGNSSNSLEGCFEPHQDQIVTAQCVMGLVNSVSSFITQLPVLQNETSILQMIPKIVNDTIKEVLNGDLGSDPLATVIVTLNTTLANIKMALQMNHLNTPEVMKEIKVVEGLIQLAANPDSCGINMTLAENPTYAEKIYLETISCYLKQVEIIISNSSLSDLLQPFLYVLHKQVSLQLLHTDFTLFVSAQVENLMDMINLPLDGTDLSHIGLTVVEMFQPLFQLIRGNLEFQNNLPGMEPFFNTTVLNPVEHQINQYINLIQKWMNQREVQLVLSSMLQWGNPHINVSTPFTDIHNLLQAAAHFFNPEQLTYLSILSNFTQSLNLAVMLAETPSGIQSDYFIGTILEVVQSTIQVLSMATHHPLPHYIEQSLLNIVNNSLKLIVQPDMNFDNSRIISIQILKNAENLIGMIFPEIAEYLLPGIKIVTTYFESSIRASGSDSWNQIILNEMITVQSLLPTHRKAQAYVSVLINITHFILESGQGNMSIWAMFESASEDSLPMVIGKLGKLFGMLWPIIMGGPGPQIPAPSLEVFAYVVPVLEDIITGMADQFTWYKLENILEVTGLWESFSSVIPLFEKTGETLVNNMEAKTVMILSLEEPIVALLTEVVQLVNSSHFSLTEVSGRMQAAIEDTLQAAQQANGTLKCSDILKAWDPVREVVGLNREILASWCSISIQPVLEAYNEALIVYSNLNMSLLSMVPTTADAAAERIVETLRSVYQVSLNHTHVAQSLIRTISSHLSMLTGQPLSPEAQLHWFKQLLDIQLQNSLSSLEIITDELLMVAPSLQQYTEAVKKAAHHIVANYHQTENSSSPEKIVEDAVMIFLDNVNVTLDNILSMMNQNHSFIDKAALIDMMRQAVTHLMMMFEDVPMVYQSLRHFLESSDANLMMEKVAETVVWLASSEEFGMDMLSQAVPEVYDFFWSLLSSLTKIFMDKQTDVGLFEVFEDLADSIGDMVRQIVSSGGLLSSKNYYDGMYEQEMTSGNHTRGLRHKRESPLMPMRSPVDDFIDLFFIDYDTMSRGLSVHPTTEQITETFHVFFANPDLNTLTKGVTTGMAWNLNATQEETIDAALGMLSFFTLPRVFDMSAIQLLQQAVGFLPDGLPFAVPIKQISAVLASESPENLNLLGNTLQTAAELLQINLTDPRYMETLDRLTAQMCAAQNTDTVQLVMSSINIEPGHLCSTLMPTIQILVRVLQMDLATVTETLFETIIGDLHSYNVNSDWTSVLSQGLNFSLSSLSSLNIDISPPGEATFGEMMRDGEAFVRDVQQHLSFDSTALQHLMDTTLPNNNLEMLSWLVNLRHCPSRHFTQMDKVNAELMETFCDMPVDEWYMFSLLVARHVNTEKFIYKTVLSEELQSLVGVMLQMAELITDVMDKILPAFGQLQDYLQTIEDLDLTANEEFHQMTRGKRSTISTKATFVTLSRALCSNGILALFGIAKLPLSDDLSPSSPYDEKREEMIERFKLPRNASPFCMNMYLDMVNTTGGAIAWAFLKPMLMGQILYTPDTPVTRDIMERSNATLNELANLRKHSEDWLGSSQNILNSAEILSFTLPMLQNSLGNSFVKKFIEMQTDINVDTMRETLSNFSNMTLMLEKNKQILTQITTLSTLMVNLSSCVKFDRHRGYNSVEELDADAQELAKNRDLYASVIFKLPPESNSTRKRREASSLPPKVNYTIRMHMDNVMRTDRMRNPYYTKETHISAQMTLRYNRGFVYLQETIDRAIIAAQTGQTVAEPAVQLQPFPYPCHLRDEYLEAISFVFPLMLMMAWVLFVADFVKKLVYERELRLHEYMKMMGVNPASHFFAWFIECATYLAMTIFILTLVLKYGNILTKSDGLLLFLYLCNYGLSILAFSYLISSLFNKTFIAGLSGSLLYVLCFFPFIVVMAVERTLTFSQKNLLSLFSPTCFSYASQYVSRYESQGEGIQWSNSYTSPLPGDLASFGWLNWLMLIDSILYFVIGAYIRMVFPGKYGIPYPWYFPFKFSFWAELCSSSESNSKTNRGLLFTNIMQENQPVFSDNKGKGQSKLSSQAGEDYSHLPVGVALHSLSKMYGDQVAIHNLNVSFYEGHVTSLLGHNGAGKTTTMSLLTGLFAPTSGTIEVYGRDMQTHINDVRKELGVCMQYDVLFDFMTAKEHLLLYGQIKAPHWTKRELREQVRTILEETGMYSHRHKRVGTLSGGMKRKLSISIAFIGGSRLVVLDEPTTGVDPCSRRSIWDIVIQHKKQRTIIMSTHHLDEAEVLSDRITFLERGGLKCCGSPFHLKDKLGQGYKLTITKKMQNLKEQIDNAELKSFIQAHVPEARLKEAQGGDLVYSLPPFNSSNASSYRSLLTALDANLDALQLGGYGVSDTTLEEVFLQLAHEDTQPLAKDSHASFSEDVSDTGSLDSFPSDCDGNSGFSDNIKLTGSSTVRGMALAWQQLIALLTKRFHHSRRDWKGLIAQILLPVLFMVAAMGLGSIKNDLQHYPELDLSPALYKFGPSYSFFSNSNPNSEPLINTLMSYPGIDNECFDNPNAVCSRVTGQWRSSGNSSKAFRGCKCTRQEQICETDNYQPPHKNIPSSQILYNLSGINVENYLLSTTNDFIRNRYGGFAFGLPLPPELQMDVKAVPKNRTLSKVWFNPEGHHTMPAYLNSINNFILRSNLPADKDPRQYAISVSSHPYFGRADDEDSIIQGMLQILVAMCVMTGYSITTASFAIYVVSEHHSGSKRLQHISGISEHFYWIVNFLYDMAMYLIPVSLTIVVIAAFQIPAFTDRQNLGAVSLLLVLFGFATFPWMYLLSGIFKDAEMAFITYVCINLFISVNTILPTSILYFLSQISTIDSEVVTAIFTRLCNVFLIFPQFNFGQGMMQLARKNIEVQILSGYGIDAYQDPFSLDAVGWMFISSFIAGVVLFSLRLLLNKFIMRKVRNLLCHLKMMPHVSYEEEDKDVVMEHQRVASGAAGSDILQINQLGKVYQSFSRKVHAVKRVSLGIPAGECFGLLGVNGAGKTTTFKMLTGDVSPTEGTAQIRDRNGRLVDIMECRNQGINIGYCPQVDALDNLLTGEEHLYFYARIRGISKRDINHVVRYLLRRLELDYHRNITTEGYSCGTRRKLSTALSLIGHPQILLLDEPSSGMDPRTKRHLWKIISEEVKGKCAVVLTSHSMEECEALCSRLAIMVKGQFRCLGSLQHIKNRFGSGFTVKMYLVQTSCNAEAITSFMQRRFPSTYLKDQHSNMVEFHVPVAPGGVADIFDQLESNKSALGIKHFSVSQTTLDEVFINFAMENSDNMDSTSINEDPSDSDSMGSVEAVQS